MQLPIALHKDTDSVYGVTVPDIPGCYSWGDTVENAVNNAKEAIYSHLETLLELEEAFDIKPSPIEYLQKNEDMTGALWVLVDVDLSQLNSKPERVNVSLPHFVLRRVDAYAEKRHESRSGLLARAALRLLEEEGAYL